MIVMTAPRHDAAVRLSDHEVERCSRALTRKARAGRSQGVAVGEVAEPQLADTVTFDGAEGWPKSRKALASMFRRSILSFGLMCKKGPHFREDCGPLRCPPNELLQTQD
jgi:hypothetical protein